MKKRPDEQGFALLLVFVMAASIAIFLYMQLPRAAFESQREKEQMLIDRGEQYQRAIGLFMKKNGGRYPTKLDDLENFNNIRYLRHRYKDPMTGKDEWRLIHVGPGGVLIDSVLTKNKGQGKDGEGKANSNQFITEMPGVGQTAVVATTSVLTRRRASEMPGAPGQLPDSGAAAGTSGGTGDPNSASNQTNPAAAWGSDPSAAAGGDASSPYGNNRSGQGYPASGASSASDGLSSGQAANSQTGGIPGVPRGSATQGTNLAVQMIQSVLTNARPAAGQTGSAFGNSQPGSGFGGGQPGSAFGNSPSQSGSSDGQIIGAQIAGVASTLEAESIKSYNDRTKYNEWEFIYDRTKDKSLALGTSMNGGRQPGSSNTNSSGSFGSSSGFGGGGNTSSTFSQGNR